MDEMDLESALTGKAPPKSAAASGPAALPDTSDEDLITRAAVAEGDPNNPQSWQNIAGVIKNRMKASGKSAAEVLSEPNAFTTYRNGKIQAVDQDSKAYQAAKTAISPVLSGDITSPYDSFISPSLQKSSGADMPSWAKDGGTQIGSQLFFSGKYGAQPDEMDLGQALGTPAEAQAAAPPKGPTDPNVVNSVTKQPYPLAQGKGIEAWAARHGMNPNAPEGSADKPYVMTADNPNPPKGSYYFDPQGQLHDPNVGETIGTGVVQGLEDVGNSLIDPMLRLRGSIGNAILPGSGAQDLQAVGRDVQGTQNYNRLFNGSPYATGGRIGGNVLATAPLMASGDALLAGASKLAPALAPAAEFLGGTAGGNNLLIRAPSLAVRGALQGGEGAALTASANPDQSALQQVGQGALAGSVLGPAVHYAGEGTGTVLNSLSPSSVSPGVAQLADAAVNKYGLPLRAGQIMGANGDRASAYADSNLLGSVDKFRVNNDAQKSAFMRGVTGTYGDASGDVSPGALKSARSQVGSVFDRVANNTTIMNTDDLQTKLSKIVHDAQSALPDNEVSPLLKQVENIGSVIENGQMPGASYQALTRANAPLDRLQKVPNAGYYAGQIRDALDDALEASANPQDVADLQKARFQYKNLMTVAKLAPKADVNGNISPALLRGAVNTNFKNAAFQGAGDLGELAQIGQTFLKEPPNSGTANRAAHMIGPLSMGAGAVGEMAALALHNPQLAIGTVAGVMGHSAVKSLGRALEEYKLGPATTNKLISNSLNASQPMFNGLFQSPQAQALGTALQGSLAPSGAIGVNRLMQPNSP